jgi:hypothetical protein
MVQSLFQSIIYDLDDQKIVDFTLQPWAERFIVLCTRIENESAETSFDIGTKPMLQICPWRASGQKYGLPRSLAEAIAYLISIQYIEFAPYRRRRTPQLNQRDQIIKQLHADGIHPNEIAAQFGITPERVYQIIKPSRK